MSSVLQAVENRFGQSDSATLGNGAGLLLHEKGRKLIFACPASECVRCFPETRGFEHLGKKTCLKLNRGCAQPAVSVRRQGAFNPGQFGHFTLSFNSTDFSKHERQSVKNR